MAEPNDDAAIRITEAEWPLMESVWRRDGQTAGEVLHGVPPDGRSHRTLRTLLARLVSKGLVRVQADRGRHLYTAAVSREQSVRSAATSFKERFFAGSLKSMLLHFVDQETLSEDEIRELKRRLDSRGRRS